MSIVLKLMSQMSMRAGSNPKERSRAGRDSHDLEKAGLSKGGSHNSFELNI